MLVGKLFLGFISDLLPKERALVTHKTKFPADTLLGLRTPPHVKDPLLQDLIWVVKHEKEENNIFKNVSGVLGHVVLWKLSIIFKVTYPEASGREGQRGTTWSLSAVIQNTDMFERNTQRGAQSQERDFKYGINMVKLLKVISTTGLCITSNATVKQCSD